MTSKQLRTYFENLVADSLSGGGWDPARTWHRVHGDTKSSVGGIFHIETMKASNGDFNAKLMGYPSGSQTSITVQAADPQNPNAAGPTLIQVAAALQAALL